MFEALKLLGKHFAIYGVGRILSRMISFVLLPVYLNYLTAEDYGTLELLELTNFVIMMFVAGGISGAVMRFYYDSDDEQEKKRVVSTALISIWGSSLFFLTWLLFFAPEISFAIFESTEFTGLFRLMFVSMVISLTNEIPLSFIRARQKSTLFTVLSIIQLVLALTLNILFIVGFEWGIRGIIYSGIISQAISGVFLGIYTFRYSGFGYSIAQAKQLMRYGLPLIPVGLGYFSLNFADRYFILQLADLSLVGIYALAYKFGMLTSSVVTGPFLSIYTPILFEMAQKDESEAQRFVAVILTYLIFISTFLVLTISVLVKDGLLIISDPVFYDAYRVVPIIGLAYIALASYKVIQIGILFKKRTKYLAYMVVTAAALNMGLNLLLIPRFGVWGAAIATTVAYFSLFLMNMVINRRMFPIRPEYMRIGKLLTLATALYLFTLQLNFESTYLSLFVKFLICLSYPGLLMAIGFLTPREKEKAMETIHRLKARKWVVSRASDRANSDQPDTESGD